MVDEYKQNWGLTIREVAGGAVVVALTFSTVMTLVGRRHFFSKALTEMTHGPVTKTGITTLFYSLCGRMGVQNVSLQQARLGTAFSVSLSGRGFVALSPGLASSLSLDETEAVLAHELSHIKNGDSRAKGMARLVRFAFRFDPVLRLVEAAVHRERELWADRVAIEFTKKPLALASALVKASSQPKLGSMALSAGLFVGGSGRGVFSFYPNLEKRVDILLALARRMEFASVFA